jgi:tetratricopeptide (TPR) repeat protein
MSGEHPVPPTDFGVGTTQAPPVGKELTPAAAPPGSASAKPWFTQAGVVNPREEKLEIKSINFLLVAMAIPSVLMALAIVVVIFWIRSMKPLDSFYAERALTAMNARDYSTAYLCYKRAIQLYPDEHIKSRLMFGMAMTLDAQGKSKLQQAQTLKGDARRAMAEEGVALRGRAISLVRKLAPEDQLGDLPQAHIWLAQVMMFELAQTKPNLRSVEAHLRHYLKRPPTPGDPDPNSIAAKAMLGHLCMITHRYKMARPYLEETVSDRPMLLVELAEACMALGENKEAEEYARRARDYYGPILADNPENTEARTGLATATSILGNPIGAIKLLEDGLSKTPTPALRHAMAQVYLNWVETIANAETPNPALPVDNASGGGSAPDASLLDRVELLEKGLRFEPSNKEIVERLATIVMHKKSLPLERNAARSVLVTLAASGKGPPEVYNALAEDAYDRGQLEQAREYWELSYKVEPWKSPDLLEPRHAVLLNNLAWLMASTPPVELERGLALANQALTMKPGDPRFRGTRGEILAKLGREKEAIPDLKAAVDAKAGSDAIRTLLAKLQSKLGQEDKPLKPRVEIKAPPSS